jgi:hypothetical protein
VGPQWGPSSAHAPAGTKPWRWKWALRVWSQVGKTIVAPSGPPRGGWPHGRRVWLAGRNRRVRKSRLCPKMRALRTCGTVHTVWKEGVGSHAARCASTHWAVGHVGHVGQWRFRHEL